MFASRTDWNLSPNRLTQLREKRLTAGQLVLDLTETNPTRCGFRYPADRILQALSRADSLVYEPDPLGLPAARRAVAAEYAARGVAIDPGRLVLTASTSEAYAWLFRLLAGPGETVLAPAPSYPLFDLLARICDVTLVPYPLSTHDAFGIDFGALDRAAGPGVRAVLAVSPGNPAGQYLKRGELDGLADFCASRGIPLICDEVFSDYAFADDPRRAPSVAAGTPALAFALNGLSKMLALPQLKLGWIAVSGPAEQAAAALGRLEVIADTFLSVNTPVQRGLPDLLALRPSIQAEVMARVRANRESLERQAAPPHPARCLPAEGGWSAILEVPRTRSDEEWALELLDRDGVLVHPGYFFDFPDEGRLVLSLLPPPGLFDEAVGRLLRRVAEG